MKREKIIIDLDENKAKEFLLKEESYISFDLPIYFEFKSLIDEVDKVLNGKELSYYKGKTPRDSEDINYCILTNKDGKYSWRPLQLINPALYVSLVHRITEKKNWECLTERFKQFRKLEKIECNSLPSISETKKNTDKGSQILMWWNMIEQKSLNLSLKYEYILQTDITDCYSSIYTHSIPWSIHGKKVAKENKTDDAYIGNVIDNHLQDMNYGQTNGIPQGSVLMDFIAEIVLSHVDLLLEKKLSGLKNDFKILRYRDDYRIFTNNPFEAGQIIKVLSELLSERGLKLNAGKTYSSDNIIKSSLKPDKRYWIEHELFTEHIQRKDNKLITENKQKWLIKLYLFSENFPNSGTLIKQMSFFLDIVKSKLDDKNVEPLISIVTEIAFRNPRVVPHSIAIISFLLRNIYPLNKKKKIIKRIYDKFQKLPNSDFLNIWLQRLTVKIDNTLKYDESICKLLDTKVDSKKGHIWNIDWIKGELKNKINNTPVVNETKVKEMEPVISKEEVKKMNIKKAYNY